MVSFSQSNIIGSGIRATVAINFNSDGVSLLLLNIIGIAVNNHSFTVAENNTHGNVVEAEEKIAAATH